jgi:aerobic carbon-monoxide dehydrogenase small subunit
MQETVSLTVNGKKATATVEGRTLLVQLLRENLGLTGTHVGCDTSQCGACVVHINGEAVKSCRSKASLTATSCIRCRKPSATTTRCNAASARPAW